MKPDVLQLETAHIPPTLMALDRWVMWKIVEKGIAPNTRWSKIPYQTNKHEAKTNDATTWTNYGSAIVAYGSSHFDGVGFVLTDDDNLVGIDVDDCRDPATGDLSALAKDILQHVEGYAEISPSGTGIKIFTRANCASAKNHDIGLEIYSSGRYFTVTGHHLTGSIPDEEQDLSEYIALCRTSKSVSRDEFANWAPPVDGYTVDKVESEILPHFDPDAGYSDWLDVGMALHHQFQGDIEGCDLWDRWSFSEGNAHKYVSGECERKWDGFSPQGGKTLRTLLYLVKQRALKQAHSEGKLVIEPNQALDTARTFLSLRYERDTGHTLVYFQDNFYRFNGTHYAITEELTILGEIVLFLSTCFVQEKKGNIVRATVSDTASKGILAMVRTECHLEATEFTKLPVWLRDGEVMPDATRLVPMKNGAYHLDEDVVLETDPRLFAPASLPFDYDANAECPEWHKFLYSVFEDDEQAKDCLQEMFGYILTGDRAQQKMFNIVGPRRSGKGTINSILVDLIGANNVVGADLEELSGTFGLEPLINKPLLTFTDARVPDRNRGNVVSILLRIVGNDTVTVNRKNKLAVTMEMPARVVMYSNEALQLNENSNAFTGRMINLQMRNSFYGREDVHLGQRLRKELSGIFNWALEGNARRLQRGGRFIEPDSARELVQTMIDVGNPMVEFIDTYFDFEREASVSKKQAYGLWRLFCSENGMVSGNAQTFHKKMQAQLQDKPAKSERKSQDGRREYVYVGLTLNADALSKLGEFN